MMLRERWEALYPNQSGKTIKIEDGRTHEEDTEADHTAETEEEGKQDTGVEEGVYWKS